MTQLQPKTSPPCDSQRAPQSMLASRCMAWLALGQLFVAGGCTAPCDDLRDRSQRCNAAQAAYIDPDHSVCQAAAEISGQADFESFARCVYKKPCNRENAISDCLDTFAAEAEPCERFKLWASACGLEPVGTEKDCATLSASVVPGSTGEPQSNPIFAHWVACVTTDECPTTVDSRYDRCQSDVLPSGPVGLIAACLDVAAWGEACAGEAVDLGIPGLENNLVSCMTQAQQFTLASYISYSQCLVAVECDNLVGRIICLDKLIFVDSTAAAAACTDIANYADACGLDELPGGSYTGCVQLLMRATPQSVGAYANCVTNIACSSAATSITCLGLLEFVDE